MSTKTMKKAALATLSLAILAATQGAFAHTTLSASVGPGGTSPDNYVALQVGHGVDAVPAPANGQQLPVIAQAVVWGYDDTTSVITGPTTGNQPPAGAKLSDLITNAAGLAGAFKPIVDHSTFLAQGLTQDPNGNTIGFWGNGGVIPGQGPLTSAQGYIGLTRFKVTAPAWNPNSCVTKLLVKLDVADIAKFNAKGKKVLAGQANLWLHNPTPKFPDDTVNGPIDGIGTTGTANSGAPATLTINRDLTSASSTYNSSVCDGAGATVGSGGFTAIVWSTDANTDANLKIPGVWPK